MKVNPLGYLIFVTMLNLGCSSSSDNNNAPDITEDPKITEPTEDPKIIEIILEGVGTTAPAYKWIPQNDAAAGIADRTEKNPTIILTLGKRYKIFNPTFLSHPLELRDDNGNDDPRDDESLLSQQQTRPGNYESDNEINWIEDTKEGTMTFTATEALAARLTTYVCLTHLGRGMQGKISIQAPLPTP